MGRSKNLHFVEHTITIEQPDDPEENWASGVIQVDKVLSEELGRTIRNGNSFRLVGYGSSLRGYIGSGDQDIGYSGVSVVQYCPVTKNSVGAWQSLQKQWMRQKQLSSGVGKYVRYDDFELGWTDGFQLPVGRNSTILMEGMKDTASETTVVYGSSVPGSSVSLNSYYNNLNPIPVPSEDPFGNVIKTAKFSNKFPDARHLTMPTSFSAMPFSIIDPITGLPVIIDVGGMASGSINWLPADNHLSHMTGTLYYYFKGIPGDNIVFTADDLKLTITLVYEGWAPLAKVRSAKSTTRKQLSTTASAKKTTNARRRS